MIVIIGVRDRAFTFVYSSRYWTITLFFVFNTNIDAVLCRIFLQIVKKIRLILQKFATSTGADKFKIYLAELSNDDWLILSGNYVDFVSHQLNIYSTIDFIT